MEGNDIILIDEVLTPDSSRFWPMNSYTPGKSPDSFDNSSCAIICSIYPGT
jgi:phosphoribosylaminoimidazole-succinocarboxamide synthase